MGSMDSVHDDSSVSVFTYNDNATSTARPFTTSSTALGRELIDRSSSPLYHFISYPDQIVATDLGRELIYRYTTEKETDMDICIEGVTPAEIEALHAAAVEFDTPFGVFLARVKALLPPQPPELRAGLVYHYWENSNPKGGTYRIEALSELEDPETGKTDKVAWLSRVYGNRAGAAGSTLVEKVSKINDDFLRGRVREGEPADE